MEKIQLTYADDFFLLDMEQPNWSFQSTGRGLHENNSPVPFDLIEFAI